MIRGGRSAFSRASHALSAQQGRQDPLLAFAAAPGASATACTSAPSSTTQTTGSTSTSSRQVRQQSFRPPGSAHGAPAQPGGAVRRQAAHARLITAMPAWPAGSAQVMQQHPIAARPGLFLRHGAVCARPGAGRPRDRFRRCRFGQVAPVCRHAALADALAVPARRANAAGLRTQSLPASTPRCSSRRRKPNCSASSRRRARPASGTSTTASTRIISRRIGSTRTPTLAMNRPSCSPAPWTTGPTSMRCLVRRARSCRAVRAQHPAARFYIVGTRPSARCRRWQAAGRTRHRRGAGRASLPRPCRGGGRAAAHRARHPEQGAGSHGHGQAGGGLAAGPRRHRCHSRQRSRAGGGARQVCRGNHALLREPATALGQAAREKVQSCYGWSANLAGVDRLLASPPQTLALATSGAPAVSPEEVHS